MTNDKPQRRLDQATREGRLQARPAQPTGAAEYGTQPLGLDGKDALLYVPAGYRPEHPAPLAVMCHGAGGSAGHGLDILQYLADELGLLLLAPASRRQSWDIIVDDYGPDIAFIDEALTTTFERCAVDPERIAIGGFSDGASYALSVGIMNGDLFTHILAFSPGFMAPLIQRKAPKLFISHGTHDDVLPIDRCSRQIVPQLMQAGYDVRYQEFDGPHTVPPDISRETGRWFVGEL
jgi:phospholipase/carboxylesterase